MSSEIENEWWRRGQSEPPSDSERASERGLAHPDDEYAAAAAEKGVADDDDER